MIPMNFWRFLFVHEKQFACYLVSQSELQMTHVEYGSGAADTLYVYHFAL